MSDSHGPMGYGMCEVENVEHDGHGRPSFEEHPFVVMKDRAFVDLGSLDRAQPLDAASR